MSDVPQKRTVFTGEFGPPPTRRSKMPQDASHISDESAPSPQVSNAATTPQRAPVAAKNPSPDSRQRSGRKPDPNSTLPRVFDSIRQCSARTGIPVSTLRDAKKADCGAFRHSRVDLVEFLRWRFGQPEDAIGDWGEALKEFKARREKIALDKDLELIADRVEVATVTAKAVATLFNELDREVTLTLPASLRGLSESQIKDLLVATLEVVKKNFRQGLVSLLENVNVNKSK